MNETARSAASPKGRVQELPCNPDLFASGERDLERCPSGLRSTLGKRVYVNSVSRVRIPLSPPYMKKRPIRGVFHLTPSSGFEAACRRATRFKQRRFATSSITRILPRSTVRHKIVRNNFERRSKAKTARRAGYRRYPVIPLPN